MAGGVILTSHSLHSPCSFSRDRVSLILSFRTVLMRTVGAASRAGDAFSPW